MVRGTICVIDQENHYFSVIYSASRQWFGEPFARKLNKMTISQSFTRLQENGSGNHSPISYSPSREWFGEPFVR